ncbi:hypothetical protein B7Z17_02125, partial [Candidatus Saccharibacteria bacterium 32-49-10]
MNNKNKRVLIVSVVATLLIVGVAVFVLRDWLFRGVSEQFVRETTQVDRSSDTYKQYALMTGEMYDRMFIANMITHHQGAVDMAKMALENAKHQELKDLAEAIILAQEKEITSMTAWQKKWGYPSTEGDTMMDHSSMGMMHSMDSMNAELAGRTGDTFDKAFLEQMITHHQSAIDMAAPGEKNAEHQELKDLTNVIVTNQTKE